MVNSEDRVWIGLWIVLAAMATIITAIACDRSVRINEAAMEAGYIQVDRVGSDGLRWTLPGVEE